MNLKIADVLSPEEVQAILIALDEGTFVDGRETAENQAAIAKRNLQLASNSNLRRDLSRRVTERVLSNTIFLHAVHPKTLSDFHFSRYEVGMTYGDHVDNAVMRLGSDSPLRADMSMTLFLSDPATYEGGELVVNSEIAPDPIKLPAGHAVIYPTMEFHQVAPVTSGVRRAAVCWIQSLIRKPAQRDILTEMWMVMDQLHKMQPEDKLAENPAYRLVNKARTNLIRMWAET